MDRLLHRFLPGFIDHLTEDQLVSLWSKSLAPLESFVARQHLAGCQLCRIRQASLESRSDRMFMHLQRHIDRQDPQPPADDPKEFLQRLDMFLAGYVPQKKRSFRWPMIVLPELPSMNPALVTCMVLALGAFVSFVFWYGGRVPSISSNALMVRAERWDTDRLAETSRVVYQEVKITTPEGATQRRIYRDPKGVRRLKAIKLSAQDSKIAENFRVAGIDWDEPLSASSYQQWHDGQRVREDEITREGRHLLTLTTVTPDGPVKTQTLTVRDTDFHPVRRTIAFRDSGTLEIAELEFKLLPWSSIDADIFQPLGTVETAASEIPARVIPFRMPAMPTPQQLDEAELSVRLVLNQLHADTGEQIQVSRTPQGIQVAGVVDTEERKAQLQIQLRALPYVAPKIESLTDIGNGSSGKESEVQSVAVISTSTKPSPLEIYLVPRGKSLSTITELAKKLNSSALTISQESRAIHSLQTQFSSAHPRSTITSATLMELVFSHRQRLQAALKEEHTLIQSMMDSDALAVATGNGSLTVMADKNLALCGELTTSGTPESRNAQLILTELSASLEQLTAGSHDFQDMPKSGPVLDGKR